MRLLSLIFCLFSTALYAQQYPLPVKTSFNKFVEKPTVKWAIYQIDTLQTDQPDLREILINKMRSGKIKTYTPVASGDLQENNLQRVILNKNEGNSNKTFPDIGPKGTLNVEQILYVENGKLFSYISRVSPLKNIFTSSGEYLGKGEYFTTSIHYKHSNKNFKKKESLFLKQSSTLILLDSIDKKNKLKETYGQNLLETLWPYMVANKIPVYNAFTNELTSLTQINTLNQLNLPTIKIPIYDSVGNFDRMKIVFEQIQPKKFNKILITQQWYYNERKNIVYCIIPEAFLFLKKEEDIIKSNDNKPSLKITF